MEPEFRDPTMPPEMQTRIGDKGLNLFHGFEVPFRTAKPNTPLYKEDDPESKRPQPVYDVDARVFQLGDEEDRKEYVKILNMCARGLGRVMEQDTQYDGEDKNWRVLLVWTQYFYEDPAETKQNQRKFYE